MWLFSKHCPTSKTRKKYLGQVRMCFRTMDTVSCLFIYFKGRFDLSFDDDYRVVKFVQKSHPQTQISHSASSVGKEIMWRAGRIQTMSQAWVLALVASLPKKRTPHCESWCSSATLRPASPNGDPNQMAKSHHQPTLGPCSFPHEKKKHKKHPIPVPTARLDYKQQRQKNVSCLLPPPQPKMLKGMLRSWEKRGTARRHWHYSQVPVSFRTLGPFFPLWLFCLEELLLGPQEACVFDRIKWLRIAVTFLLSEVELVKKVLRFYH